VEGGMGETVTIQRIGDRCGIMLPQEHLDKLGWKEGDRVEIRSDQVHIEFTAPNGDYSEAARSFSLTHGTAMRNYLTALKELARH
jgi:bifunctional DNA-binding transcriptional regulator/antitoxin component of YhaV-PrlF toxin-antitoxin module